MKSEYWSEDWDDAMWKADLLSWIWERRYRVTFRRNPVNGHAGWLVKPAR